MLNITCHSKTYSKRGYLRPSACKVDGLPLMYNRSPNELFQGNYFPTPPLWFRSLPCNLSIATFGVGGGGVCLSTKINQSLFPYVILHFHNVTAAAVGILRSNCCILAGSSHGKWVHGFSKETTGLKCGQRSLVFPQSNRQPWSTKAFVSEWKISFDNPSNPERLVLNLLPNCHRSHSKALASLCPSHHGAGTPD